MRFLFSSLLLVLLPVFLTNCGLLRKRGDKDNKPQGDIVIGSIDLVNPEQKFVLIRTHSSLVIPAGSNLFTYSPSGLKAVLKVSPERKLSFLSADIVEGYPQRGHPVFMTLESAQAHAAAAAQPASPASDTQIPPPDPTLHWGGAPSGGVNPPLPSADMPIPSQDAENFAPQDLPPPTP